eukprot:5574328-Prorocentrum_lima.AAC.1
MLQEGADVGHALFYLHTENGLVKDFWPSMTRGTFITEFAFPPKGSRTTSLCDAWWRTWLMVGKQAV